MVTENVELTFPEWRSKILEKLTFAQLKIADGKDITEEDYDLLRELYRVYHSGRYPLFGSKLQGDVELAIQQGLFADRVAEISKDLTEIGNGMDIDTPDDEPKQ